MYCYLNDLSLNNGALGLDFENLVKTFMEVCDKLKEESFEKILVMPEFTLLYITDDKNINTILNTYPRNNSLRIRLKSFLINQMQKIKHSDDYEPYKEIIFNAKKSILIKYALINNAPLISFQTHDLYLNNFLKVESFTINGDYSVTDEKIDIENFSSLSHFNIHSTYLASKQRENIESDKNWNPILCPFRLIAKMNSILSDRDYENQKKVGNQSQKMALYYELGTELANINGWSICNKLSERNSTALKKRKIFKAKNVYLSLDFMHGAFELHISNGTHITEYGFNGVDNNKHYTDTSHDIIVK